MFFAETVYTYIFVFIDSFNTPLAHTEVEVQGKTKPAVAPRSRHIAAIPNGTEEENDKNVYMDLLAPSAEDLKRAKAHSDSRLLKKSAAAAQRIPVARK